MDGDEKMTSASFVYVELTHMKIQKSNGPVLQKLNLTLQNSAIMPSNTSFA